MTIVVGHATNLIVAALDVVKREKMVMTLLAYASNANCPHYSRAPFGGDYGE